MVVIRCRQCTLPNGVKQLRNPIKTTRFISTIIRLHSSNFKSCSRSSIVQFSTQFCDPFRGRSRGGLGARAPSQPPKMRPQHQNSTKLRPQNGSFRPVTIWDPPLIKSWIRPCLCQSSMCVLLLWLSLSPGVKNARTN